MIDCVSQAVDVWAALVDRMQVHHEHVDRSHSASATAATAANSMSKTFVGPRQMEKRPRQVLVVATPQSLECLRKCVASLDLHQVQSQKPADVVSEADEGPHLACA